jgi:hypothetical protein
MKKNSILFFLLLPSVFLLSECHKSNGDNTNTCIRTTGSVTGNKAFTDPNATSPYYNQVVGAYNYTQVKVHFSGTGNCPQDSIITILVIANSTAKTMSLSYDFFYSDTTGNICGGGSLYNVTVSIAPNGSIYVGEVNKRLLTPNPACNPYFYTNTLSYN